MKGWQIRGEYGIDKLQRVSCPNRWPVIGRL